MLKETSMSRVTPARRSAEDRCGYRVPGCRPVPALLRLGPTAWFIFSRPIASDGCGFGQGAGPSPTWDLRAGLNAAEHAISDLTAITEDGLDLQDEGVAFRLRPCKTATLPSPGPANLPQIAQRARLELKL